MGLSNEQKVLLVETAILEGSKDDILRVIKENTPFEFTARALAFACRYRDLEIVKILVENGFSFQYSYSPSIEKKYKVKYGTQTQTAPTDFSALPIPDYFVHSYDDLFDHVYFPCIQRCLRLRDILETDYEKGIVKELKNRVSDEALTSVFLFLRDQLPYFNIQKVYYYAILSNFGLACMLKQKNVFLSEDQVTEISSYDQKTLEGLEYRNMLFASFLKGDLDKTAKIFCEEFAKYGKRYMLYKQLTEEVLKEGSPVLIKELLKLGCVSTFNKKEVVEYLLENRKEDSIIVLLDYKSIEVKYLEKYLDAIVDKKLTALNALLLEKKSKSIKKMN